MLSRVVILTLIHNLTLTPVAGLPRGSHVTLLT